MSSWSKKLEEELTSLLKDWLKQHCKTQADLRESLNAETARMPALLEVLKKEYDLGGMGKLAARLCAVEKTWTVLQQPSQEDEISTKDPFGQLDLLLEEMREDYED